MSIIPAKNQQFHAKIIFLRNLIRAQKIESWKLDMYQFWLYLQLWNRFMISWRSFGWFDQSVNFSIYLQIFCLCPISHNANPHKKWRLMFQHQHAWQMGSSFNVQTTYLKCLKGIWGYNSEIFNIWLLVFLKELSLTSYLSLQYFW